MQSGGLTEALDVGSLDVATFASMIELSFESCHMGNRLAEAWLRDGRPGLMASGVS